VQLLPAVQLSVSPDSGHGGIFQHHDVFVAQVDSTARSPRISERRRNPET
jgi:pimeloyl-ACP methyl ester carboxylesterase